jgi:hypothetical protein
MLTHFAKGVEMTCLYGGEIRGRNWHVRNHQKSTICLLLILLPKQERFHHKMGRIRSRKSRARYFTPPPSLSQEPGKHPETPARYGVLFAKLYEQELGIKIPSTIVQKVTGVAQRGQTRILSSKEPRTLHSQSNIDPDPRGRKRSLRRLDIAAISNYLDDEIVPLDDRGAPWQDIVEATGVVLPKT